MLARAARKRAEAPRSERAFLAGLRKGLRGPTGASGLLLGVGDDAALWRPKPGMDSVLTIDLAVESVHFDLAWMSPWHVGARSAAASLSDLAAMGALPRLALLSLALPKKFWQRPALAQELFAGARTFIEAFGARLAGGDTTRSPGPLVVDVMLLGEVERGRALLRTGARPGDLLLVTGSLGDSAAGLQALRRRPKADAASLAWVSARHRSPLPRVWAGRALSQIKLASACIDISDGLASEAWHLSRESGVAIDIDLGLLPITAAARRVGRALRQDPLGWSLGGGEDYELLFTAAPAKAARALKELPRLGCPVRVIGKVLRGTGVRSVHGAKRKPLPELGWEHGI